MKENKPKIFILEDDAAFRHTLADILEANDYRVRAAASGSEALEMLQNEPCAVALIDLRLKDMRGMEVLESIHRLDPLTRCILMTGHASKETAIQALNQGAYYFMQKPLDMEQLLLIIRNALQSRQSELELRRSEEINRSITDAIPDCLIELDESSRVLLLRQPAGKELFLPGVTPGVQLVDLLPAAHGEMMLGLIGTTLEEDTTQEVEFSLSRGEEDRHFEIRMIPKGENQVLALIRDISQQVAIQREAEERRHYLEGVLQAAPDAIITLDSGHKVRGWSRGAEKIFGYSEGEVIGRDLDQLIFSPGSEYLREGKVLTSHVLQGQVVSPTETVRFRKDGQPVHVIVAGAPIMQEEELVGIVATYTDISERVQAEQALTESEERYRTFMDNFDGIVYRSRLGFDFSFIHGAVREITGYSREEFLTGKINWLDVVHPVDREKFLAPAAVQNSPERTLEREYRIERKGGDIRWVNEVLQIIRDEEDQVYLQAMIRDISDEKSLQEILDWQLRVNRDVAELSHKIIESAPIESITRMVLKKAQQLTGSMFGFAGYFSPTDGELVFLAMSEEVWEYYPPGSEDQIIQGYQGLWQDMLKERDTLLINQVSEGEIQGRSLRGKLPVERILSCPVVLDGQVTGFISLMNPGEDYISRDLQVVMYLADIFALALGRKQTEKKLRYMATHDDLTDLPNRVFFHDAINQTLTRVGGEDQYFAVMLLDVDKFKKINDSHGHAVGDLVLQHTANRLQKSLRGSDTIARWGGDEFVIIAESDSEYRGPQVVVEKIVEAFSELMVIQDQRISVGVSIGISLYPQDGQEGDQLIRQADAAMYAAKQQGLSSCFYAQLSSRKCSSDVPDRLRPIQA
jgi:diguanylate cyclase (GGDEF)-like protein/PAS domain S-box-containing protein